MAISRQSKAKELADLVNGIKASDFTRVYLEASLLATDDVEAIAEVFQIPELVIEEYVKTHYLVMGLNRLQKLELVSKIKDSTERELKQWAVTQGFEFVKWRLGFKVDVSPVESMLSMYSDCVFKSKEAFYSSNSDDSSKEALKWVRQATGIAQILKTWVVDSKEASKDIKLALSKVIISEDTIASLSDLEEPEPDVETE